MTGKADTNPSRRALLDTAVSMLEERGADGFTVEEILVESGTSSSPSTTTSAAGTACARGENRHNLNGGLAATRGPAPGGDVSDDSSDGLDFPTAAEFAGVKRFIWETLVDPLANTPSAERGPIIGFFLDLRGGLLAQVDNWNPQPLATLTTSYTTAKSCFDGLDKEIADVNAWVAAYNACELTDLTCSRTIILGYIIAEAVDLGLTVTLASLAALGDLIAGAVTTAAAAVAAAVDALIDAYLVAWIADIDAGLQNWGELGRAVTVAMFDPQARRDLQNKECKLEGAESTLNRGNCETEVGALDVMFDQVDPFINTHLLSMLGAPDAVGTVRQALQDLSSEISELLGELGVPFNPLEEALAVIQAYASELIKDFIEEAFGIDIDTLKSFLADPTSWLNVGKISVDLPVLGKYEILELFKPDGHELLDSYLGFTGTSHLQPWKPPFAGFPVEGSRLTDAAVFSNFAAFDNVVTLGKLLLLDGKGMDQLLSDLLGRPYSLYASVPRANVMLTPLPGVAGASPQMWLNSIDSDHAWRSDGRPVFRAGTVSGGEGNFPLWESCVLRNAAFRGLFRDWENGSQQFPDLGDAPTTDPNDPAAPSSTLLVGGRAYTAGGRTFLAASATLEVDASDDFWRANEIGVSVSITDSGGRTTTSNKRTATSSTSAVFRTAPSPSQYRPATRAARR